MKLNLINNKTFTVLTILLLLIIPLQTSSALKQSYNLTYDNNGNLIQDTNKHYTYNEHNQLEKVREDSKTGRVLEEYLYDHQGQRARKIEHTSDSTNQSTYYAGDENVGFIRVINDSGTFDTVFIHHQGQLVARIDPDNNTYYYHPDHLGSTSIVTNQSGDVVEETTYKPYGEITEGGESRYLFTGKEKDSTNIYYYGARYYNPSLRSFTQADPIIAQPYDPQNLNRYSYVQNNPYRYIDPTGNVLDVFLDIGFIAYDIQQLSQEQSAENYIALAADIASLALPFVAGGGLAVRGVFKGASAVSDLKSAGKVESARKVPNPYGKLGGPEHRAKVSEIVDEVQKTSNMKGTEALINKK